MPSLKGIHINQKKKINPNDEKKKKNRYDPWKQSKHKDVKR